MRRIGYICGSEELRYQIWLQNQLKEAQDEHEERETEIKRRKMNNRDGRVTVLKKIQLFLVESSRWSRAPTVSCSSCHSCSHGQVPDGSLDTCSSPPHFFSSPSSSLRSFSASSGLIGHKVQHSCCCRTGFFFAK